MARRKWMALCMLTSIALATGCSSSGKTDTAAPESKAPKAADKPVTYNSYRNLGIAEYPSDGGEAKKVILDSMAKAGITGFDYKVTMASGPEYTTKLNIMASSNELPDIFDIDDTTLTRFVDQGLLLPLDDYLKKAPHLMKMIPQERWKDVTFNGKIYAIPNGRRPDPSNTDSVTSILVRQDWLDALGLQQPKTFDELHHVLQEFKAKDPGKVGNVGFGATKSSQFYTVFGAFGISPNFWTERDGMIKMGMVLPEAKKALAVLQQWYKEGLIDPDFPITEAKQLQEKVINSKVGLWEDTAFKVDPPTDPTAEALFKANPKSKLVLIETPKGPDGKQGYPEAKVGLRALSKNVKNPEKLIQYLDWMCDDSDQGGMTLIHFGVEGVDYKYDRAKDLITQTSSYSELYKKGYSNPMRMETITDRRYAVQSVRDAAKIAGEHLLPNALWRTLPAEIDHPDLSKLWTEYFIKIITGAYSIDKFDEFVQKYYAQGGKEIEQQANEEWKKLKK